jgi:hypothetical protein
MTGSVFISYSSKDVKMAEKIEKYLLAKKFSVWRDKSHIRNNWSKEIADAVSKSDIVILLWSENSLQSDWVKNEWLTARALQKPIQIVVVSALDKLPKPLSNIDAIDLQNKDVNSNNLIKLDKKLKQSNLLGEYDYNILPTIKHMPYDPNPNFTGRNSDLVELYLEIIGNLSKLNYNKVGLVGTGGTGKTQIAIEFFYRYAYAFEDGIFWIDGYDPTRWLDQIVSIARDYLRLAISKKGITETEKNKRYLIEFQKYCNKNGSKMLLLVDNVIDPLDLYRDDILFPKNSIDRFTLLTLGCNLLFTTRRDIKNKLPNVIEHTIGMLSPDSAFDLLIKYRQISFSDDKKEKEETEYQKKSVILQDIYL